LQRLADLLGFPQDNARSKPPCVDGALPQVGCVHCDTEALRLAHKVDVGRVLLDEGTHERAERQHVSAFCACLVEGVPMSCDARPIPSYSVAMTVCSKARPERASR
jgi:hypothetical protein